MKNYILSTLLLVSAAPLWAGTEVRALIESNADKKAWVDLLTDVSDGQLKIHFEGPWCLGSLMYNRDTSQVTIVDDSRKTVMTLTRDNQSALKMLGALASGKLIEGIAGATPSAKKTYAMVKENAQSFFNGVPFLKDPGVTKNGFTCDGYRTDLDGKKIREVWITAPDAAGLSGEDLNTIRGLIHLVLELCGSEISHLGADTTAFEEGLSNSPLPVYAELYSKGKHSCRFQILTIKSRFIDPGTFVPPSTYKNLGLMDLINN